MDNELSKTIGKRINTLLAEQEKKQKELAAHLCVPDNTISYFVSGRRTPNTEQISKIADFFDVSADYLLGRTNAKTTDKDLRFICDYTGLSEKSVDAIKSTLTGAMEFSRPYFNHLAENLVFTELALYLERYSYNTMMKDFKGLGKEQNRKNYEKSQLLLFYAQEFIKDCFKEYKKAGDENANNPKEE